MEPCANGWAWLLLTWTGRVGRGRGRGWSEVVLALLLSGHHRVNRVHLNSKETLGRSDSLLDICLFLSIFWFLNLGSGVGNGREVRRTLAF